MNDFECLAEISTHHHSDRAVFSITVQRSWVHGHRGHGNVMKSRTVIRHHLSSAIYISKLPSLSLTLVLIQMEMAFPASRTGWLGITQKVHGIEEV